MDDKLNKKPLFPPLFTAILSRFGLSLSFALVLALVACSFDYGNEDGPDKNMPDIVMDTVEYVRVRSGDPIARFQAERAERYEERGLMALRNLSFEQFEKQDGEVNASGSAGTAEVKIDTGDIRMDNGVKIEVESEDITIVTKLLEWKDKDKTLTGGKEEEVKVLRANGTSFLGYGFYADARRRSWEFNDGANGVYIQEDEEDEINEEELITEMFVNY